MQTKLASASWMICGSIWEFSVNVFIWNSVDLPKNFVTLLGSKTKDSTGGVAALISVSSVPSPSVYCTSTDIGFPTSSCVSVNTSDTAPSII